MQYVSLIYLIGFLPLMLISYQIVPKAHRWKVLLVFSYAFFFSISGKLILYVLISTFSIHHFGIWLETLSQKQAEAEGDQKSAVKKQRRKVLILSLMIQLGMLILLKYAGFLGMNLNAVLGFFHFPVKVPVLKLALPIGISFYTLQAVSYLLDIYYGKIKADYKLSRLAVYLAFFPTIMEGPISRYNDTAKALYKGESLTYNNITRGSQRVLWGLFKKLVIADRLNAFVKTIFDKYPEYSGAMILIGAAAYTIQLYMDFSGCIDMTIGTGEMIGVTIPENFKRPFFARSTSEFWRRWHITLGTWFKDYVFFPVSLTKGVKKLSTFTRKRMGKHLSQTISSAIPLFAVWFCNGWWHGAGWNYLFFGMYYFAMILIGNFLAPYIEKLASKLHINRDSVIYRIPQTVKMLFIIVIGELFFRAKDLRAGLAMFKSIFLSFNAGSKSLGSILTSGLDIRDVILLALSISLVFIIEILQENGKDIRTSIAQRNIVIRWGVYYVGIMAVIVFGAYGEGYQPVDMLYAGF